MLTFTPLDLQSIPAVRPFMHAQPFRLSDFTCGTAFMWREYLKTAYCIYADMLLLRITLSSGRVCYTFPIGNGDLKAALFALEQHCNDTDTPFVLVGVPEPALLTLTTLYADRCTVRAYRDSADYLYNAETFLSFPGRHLSGKRNHLRRFYAAHPNCEFRPLKAADVNDAVKFMREHLEKRRAQSTLTFIETEESVRGCELIQNKDALNITAGCLWEDGRILAVAAGEIVGDTLFVHIEKGDTRYDGVYQAISQAFAQFMVRENVQYINREDDAGDEGLRRSKLSYRPCSLLEKFEVRIRRKG